MKLKVGSYVRYNRGYEPKENNTFGFIVEVNDNLSLPYKISWLGFDCINTTRSNDEYTILIYPPTKLSKLLFE